MKEIRDGIKTTRMTTNARLYACPGIHVVKHRHIVSFRRRHRGNENGGRSPRDECRFRFAQLATEIQIAFLLWHMVNSDDRTGSFGSYNVDALCDCVQRGTDSGMLARAGSVHMASQGTTASQTNDGLGKKGSCTVTRLRLHWYRVP